MSLRKNDFKIIGVDRERMLAALRLMGRKHLHRPKTMQWSSDNPTRNYCYVITEWVHRYFAPDGSTTWRVAMPHDDYTHRFNKLPDGTKIDLAAEQFSDSVLVPYGYARKFHLLKTGGPQPSRRAQLLNHVYKTGTLDGFVFKKEHGDWR